MNVLQAGNKGRRVCGAWWLFVSQQAEQALKGIQCQAVVLKMALCCNVILLFIKQAEVYTHRSIKSILQRANLVL